MGEVVPMSARSREIGGGADGSGPEDPMLEARVEKLERVEAILVRLEPKIPEIAIELKQVPKYSDFARLQADVGEIRGRLDGVDKRLVGVEGRFSQVPTIWGILGILTTLMPGMAGLILTAGKYLH